MLLFPALCSTGFAGGWVYGVARLAASAAPQAAYRTTVILPAGNVTCAAGNDGLTFTQSAITLDCSADRLFADGFQAN